jgi:hypothetical protein
VNYEGIRQFRGQTSPLKRSVSSDSVLKTFRNSVGLRVDALRRER